MQTHEPKAEESVTTEIAPYQGGDAGAVQQFQGMNLDTGLDDLGIDELPTPRLKIEHRDGLYKDSQTSAVFQGFNAVILGMVKQRVMWDGEDVEGNNNDVPKCKSNDFERGMPNVDPTSTRQFPWEESNFRRELAFPDQNLNRVLIPCANCNFKEWRTKPGTNDRKPPRCSEVWNLIVMYDPYGNGALQPAFLALKKSAIAGAKKYLATFKQRGIAAYTQWTWFSLEQESRGSVWFSKPVLTENGPTDPANWPQYSANYTALADFARTIRPAEGGATTGMQQQLDAPEFHQGQQQGVPQGAVPQTVAQAQAVQAAPVAQEPQVYTPVPMTQAPVQQPAPVQAQVVQHAAPVAPAVPAAPAAPPAPPVQQAPSAPPAQPVQQTPPPPSVPTPQTPPPPAPPVQAAPPVASPPPAPAPAVAPPPAVQSPPPAAPPAETVQAPPPPAPSPAPVAAPPAPQAPVEASGPTWAGGESLPDDDDDLPF